LPTILTETHLRNNNLPDEILQRHLKAVTFYRQNLATLLNNLDDIEAAKDSRQLSTSVDKALKHLQPL
jgi:hypothetical protein